MIKDMKPNVRKMYPLIDNRRLLVAVALNVVIIIIAAIVL